MGDVGGTGSFVDVLIGAPEYGDSCGRAYLVFGGATGSPISVGSLNGSNGYVINPAGSTERLGYDVASAGDINGDGTPDFIIGARDASPGGLSNAGKAYVVFGGNANLQGLDNQDTPGDGSINLTNLDGSNGFVVTGLNLNDRLGYSVAGLGDINVDGVDDLVVGAPFHEGNGGELANEGRAYVVFGKPLGQSFSTTVTAAQIEGGTGGFSIIGVDSNDTAGKAVSSAGDVNGDGINDILIGAPNADPVNGVSTGAAYVVFGKPAGQSFGTGVDLSGLNGTNGFRINADLIPSRLN